MPINNENNRYPINHALHPRPYHKARFSFYLRDGATSNGLKGALFELVSYEKSGRNMAISNRYGKVSFDVFLGASYALVERTPPDHYACDKNVFSLRLEENGLFINGAKESSFVIVNYQKGHRFSVVYHENGVSVESSRFSLSYGGEHKVATAGQAGIQKDGYAFVSWNQSPDGKGALWLPGDSLAVKNDIHMFAQWIPIPSGTRRDASFFSSE